MPGGFDTASYVYDVRVGAVNNYGTPSYWIRYFSPSINGTVNQSSSHANSECDAVWDSGARNLSPISEPSQSRLSGTSAQGLADAQTFVSALHSVYSAVIPLQMPLNGQLYCWLGQEASTSLSTSYWSGWSGYINSNDWSGQGYFPLYACLYCNPCQSNACTTVSTAGGCFRIWTTQPQLCGYKLSNLPTWNPKGCSTSGCHTGGGPTVQVWQFAEQPVCGLSPNVDMDEGDLSPYSFYLSARP